MAKIKIEGQVIQGDEHGITDDIAGDDELLKMALAPAWPDVRSATITRTGGKEGEELVVTVIKKAKTKGMDDSETEEQVQSLVIIQDTVKKEASLIGLVHRLLAAPVFVNPAVEMSNRIRRMAAAGELNHARLQELLPEIAAAEDTGERDLNAAREAARDLENATAIPSRNVPLGF